MKIEKLLNETAFNRSDNFLTLNFKYSCAIEIKSLFKVKSVNLNEEKFSILTFFCIKFNS